MSHPEFDAHSYLRGIESVGKRRGSGFRARANKNMGRHVQYCVAFPYSIRQHFRRLTQVLAKNAEIPP